MLTCNNGPEVTPDILSNTVSWFGGGQVYPAGLYAVGYITGSMKLQGNVSGWIAANYHIADDTGHDVLIPQAPGDANGYSDTQAGAQAANAGYCANFNHASAGKIGVYLNDSNCSDNVAGQPNPTYMLCTGYGTCQAGDGLPPAPTTPTLTATAQIVNGVPSIVLVAAGF